MKAELGQARSMFRPSGVDTHPRQRLTSQAALHAAIFLSLLSLRLFAPSQPYLEGHRPRPPLHKLTGQEWQQLTRTLFGSKASPPISSSSQLPLLLSLAAGSVCALTQTRQSTSREPFSRRSRAYRSLMRMENRHRTESSEQLPKVLAHSRVYTTLDYLEVAAAVRIIM